MKDRILQLTTQEELDRRLKAAIVRGDGGVSYRFYWDNCEFYKFDTNNVLSAQMRLHDTHFDKIKQIVVGLLESEAISAHCS